MFRHLFGRKKSAEEMVERIFLGGHRACARRFYESWTGKEFLVVDLGDGEFSDLTSELFYKSATFCFFSVPGETEQHGILGSDMQDSMGVIAVRKEDGDVVYLYEGTETALAKNIEDFLAALRDAGWHGP